jgi:hypothetical protein
LYEKLRAVNQQADGQMMDESLRPGSLAGAEPEFQSNLWFHFGNN